jgi:hypothetical protein
MTDKTTLNPVVSAGIASTFSRATAFAKLANVTPYQLGRMLDGHACQRKDIQRVEQAWEVLDPGQLRQVINAVSAAPNPVDRVAIGKLLAALDVTYEALTGVELIVVGEG